MNLRKRLTLFSSILFGVIFGIAAWVIYFTFYKSTEKSVQKELEKTCLISAIFYLEKDEQSAYQHKEVKRQFDQLIHSDMVAIYDQQDVVQFGDLYNDQNITENRLQRLKKNHQIYFQSNHHFYFGMYYPDNQGDFYVFVKEKNEEFKNSMNRLSIILFVVLLLGWMGIFFLSRFLSKWAYQPVKKIVNEIKSKEQDTLTSPLTTLNSKDELEELVNSYNLLLQRISDTFAIQRNFINYVSHEFRTPLAAISGTLEVYSQKERSAEEYKKATQIALKNVSELSSILDHLLILSEAKSTVSDEHLFRLDEVIWNLAEVYHNERSLSLKVEIKVENSDLLWVQGNETLVEMALLKLIENAFKYSENKQVSVLLTTHEQRLRLEIEDQGIGILSEDLPYITHTFFRGKNAQNVKGSGVGLSLATIIFEQHDISYQIISKKVGTIFRITFPITSQTK